MKLCTIVYTSKDKLYTVAFDIVFRMSGIPRKRNRDFVQKFDRE